MSHLDGIERASNNVPSRAGKIACAAASDVGETLPSSAACAAKSHTAQHASGGDACSGRMDADEAVHARPVVAACAEGGSGVASDTHRADRPMRVVAPLARCRRTGAHRLWDETRRGCDRRLPAGRTHPRPTLPPQSVPRRGAQTRHRSRPWTRASAAAARRRGPRPPCRGRPHRGRLRRASWTSPGHVLLRAARPRAWGTDGARKHLRVDKVLIALERVRLTAARETRDGRSRSSGPGRGQGPPLSAHLSRPRAPCQRCSPPSRAGGPRAPRCAPTARSGWRRPPSGRRARAAACLSAGGGRVAGGAGGASSHHQPRACEP